LFGRNFESTKDLNRYRKEVGQAVTAASV
jgi:hypothetical protein